MKFREQHPSTKTLKWIKVLKGLMRDKGLTIEEIEKLPLIGGNHQKEAIEICKRSQ